MQSVLLVLRFFLSSGLFAALVSAASDCDRLLKEEGLDCAACVQEADVPELSGAQCKSSAAEDAEAEKVALFDPDASKVRRLYNESNFIWTRSEPWSIELVLSPESWDFLVEKPSREEYVTGAIRVAGLGEWTGVGIRFKGFYGSLRICLENKISCTKLNYKLKFNHVNKSQRFFGLKKLQLHASVHDTSFLRERLTYSLFREMGVAAPRQTHVTVHLDHSKGAQKRRLGVYLLTEVVDGRFTDAHFKGGDGNLYKEAWPGLANGNSYFKGQLRTNEEKAEVSRLIQFGEEMKNVKTDWELVQVVKRFTHAKTLSRYWAVDRAVGNWDGPANFRWDSDAWWNHNYFMYEDDNQNMSKREFTIVPWDVDGTWNGRGFVTPYDWDTPVCDDGSGQGKKSCPGDGGIQHPHGVEVCHQLSHYRCNNGNFERLGFCAGRVPGEGEAECTKCRGFFTASGVQMPPSCFKMVRVFARGLRSYYMNASQRLLAGPLNLCRVQDKLRRWISQIKDAMASDTSAGLYPHTRHVGKKSWIDEATSFVDKTVPEHVASFRKSVSCKRNYKSNIWDGPVVDPKLKGIINIDSMARWSSWTPPWDSVSSTSSICAHLYRRSLALFVLISGTRLLFA
eukprot:TRINITY_DN27054_c0_g1_i1.p1 TRINITY_DN27054_c0_g1~~TRINITY_DN27054_c0_g1_i1.p1  ORF type:complete len:623 (+),score=68.80 TRINITY_DN27054_c0_g1_i1:62-1930(+)